MRRRKREWSAPRQESTIKKKFSSAFSEKKRRGTDTGREKYVHKSWFFHAALKSEDQCRDIGSVTLLMQLLKGDEGD